MKRVIEIELDDDELAKAISDLQEEKNARSRDAFTFLARIDHDNAWWRRLFWSTVVIMLVAFAVAELGPGWWW